MPDFCDLIRQLRAYVFMADRDITLQVNRKVILGDGTILDDLADAPFVLTALSAAMPNERALAAGTAVSVTDGGAGGNVTVAHTQVAAGDLHTEYTREAVLTAKGSIYAASAASTPAELAVGADGKAIVADSLAATGLNWSSSSPDGVAAAQFVTMAVSADLANERVLTGGTAVSVTDGGAGGNATLNHTQVAAGDLHTEYVRKATLTAKGSIYAASAASTPAELGVGVDGTVLMADSAQATGLAWSSGPNGWVPIGGIILWSGAIINIPANWQICDGTNGTPDLRDRFVIGAGNTYAVNDTGGSATKDVSHAHGDGTLAAAAGGDHSHTGNTGYESSHTHSADGTLATDSYLPHVCPSITQSGPDAAAPCLSHSHDVIGDTSAGSSHRHTISASGTHTHDVTGNTSSGGGAAQDVLNPYYALAYIQRMS